MDLTSRYAVKSDCRDKLEEYYIPDEWWSRKAEYPWAAQFVKPRDWVADMACGVHHFFKHYLAQHSECVYAVDNDPELNKLPTTMKLMPIVSDLWHVPAIADSSLDIVYCISVLEHLIPDGRLMSLKEMHRVLKPNGLVVCTFDVPIVTPEEFGATATKSGLIWAGPLDMTCPADALYSGAYKLNVFMAVLRKP